MPNAVPSFAVLPAIFIHNYPPDPEQLQKNQMQENKE